MQLASHDKSPVSHVGIATFCSRAHPALFVIDVAEYLTEDNEDATYERHCQRSE